MNRTPERAAVLAAEIPGPVEAGGLDQLDVALAAATVIVNTTSAGVAGQGEGPRIDWRRAPPEALATDINYVPLVTPFLAGAAQAGLAVCDGLGMLLHQAVPGFERWFGRRPVVDETLRATVIADLDAG